LFDTILKKVKHFSFVGWIDPRPLAEYTIDTASASGASAPACLVDPAAGTTPGETPGSLAPWDTGPTGDTASASGASAPACLVDPAAGTTPGETPGSLAPWDTGPTNSLLDEDVDNIERESSVTITVDPAAGTTPGSLAPWDTGPTGSLLDEDVGNSECESSATINVCRDGS
jgi:hypothetical protein